ncbi:MAG: EF-hand domain-containing protein [Gammaproteobacteria bacterium]
MKRLAFWVGAAALAAGAPLVLAVDPAVPDFKSMDTDTDGFISMKEASTAPAVEKVFAAVDKDGDQRLSATEYVGAFGAGQTESGAGKGG